MPSEWWRYFQLRRPPDHRLVTYACTVSREYTTINGVSFYILHFVFYILHLKTYSVLSDFTGFATPALKHCIAIRENVAMKINRHTVK